MAGGKGGEQAKRRRLVPPSPRSNKAQKAPSGYGTGWCDDAVETPPVRELREPSVIRTEYRARAKQPRSLKVFLRWKRQRLDKRLRSASASLIRHDQEGVWLEADAVEKAKRKWGYNKKTLGGGATIRPA